MRRWLLIPALAIASSLSAEIIDRIAVVVGSAVITASEVDREVRLTDFLNQTPLDLNVAARKKAVDRLIEQRLINREVELTRYPTPARSDADKPLAAVKARFKTAVLFEQALKEYGISEQDLKDHLYRQLTILRFIEQRFRPGIQISEEETQQEFARRANEKPSSPQSATLDESHQQITDALIERRVDQQLEQWLKNVRARTKIEIREEALQ